MATINGWNNQVAASNSDITLNAGTNTINIGSDASANTINIGTGAAAKVATLGSTNGASSLALKYGTADFSLASATGNVIVAQDTGEVTKPLQPAFLAWLSATANNVTGDTTAYTVIFDTEIFDQNADFDTGTGVFTAPVGGRYQFNTTVLFGGLSNLNTAGYVGIVTSNRTYYWQNNMYNISTGGQAMFSLSVLADMDAGDTVHVVAQAAGSGKVVDIVSGGVATDPRTWFSGFLVC